jgi:hypothetical protein
MQDKEIKRVKIENEVKLFLFADVMILYLKEPIRNLLDPINIFSKVDG